MSGGVPDIICVAQITFKIVDHALIVDNRGLLLFKIIWLIFLVWKTGLIWTPMFALKTILISATQIVWGTPPDIYTSALTNTNTRQSGGILSNTVYWRLIWLISNFLSWRNIDLTLTVLFLTCSSLRNWTQVKYSERLYSRQTLYVTLRANIESLSLRTYFQFLLVSLHLYSLSFYSILTS